MLLSMSGWRHRCGVVEVQNGVEIKISVSVGVQSGKSVKQLGQFVQTGAVEQFAISLATAAHPLTD